VTVTISLTYLVFSPKKTGLTIFFKFAYFVKRSKKGIVKNGEMLPDKESGSVVCRNVHIT